MLFIKSVPLALLSLVAVTSAWPTAFSVVTRDALADPVADSVAIAAIDASPPGAQVANLFLYNTTSTNQNTINGAKKCQTQQAVIKLVNGACWSTPTAGLGIKLSSAVSGCKVYGYATRDCSGDKQQISGATCFDVSNTGIGPFSLFTVC